MPRITNKAQTVSALILNQNHVYLGKMKVMLIPTAIKMVGAGEFKFSLLSKGPKWEVTVYRTDDRLACTQSLEQFCDQGLFSNMVLRQKTRMLPASPLTSVRKISGFAVRRSLWDDTIFECIPIKGYAAQQAEHILHAAYKLPTNGQIPITWDVRLTGKDWMTQLSEEGMRRVFLGTEKISKAEVPISEFEVPTGLAREKSITRIVVGDAEKMNQTGVDILFELRK